MSNTAKGTKDDPWQLAPICPRCSRCSTSPYRLADGVTFIHVATLDGEENPLAGTAAFAKFQEGLDERCAEPPSPTPATVVGRYQG